MAAKHCGFDDVDPITSIQGWVGFGASSRNLLIPAIYLFSGAYLDARLNGAVRIAMLHSLHHVEKDHGTLKDWNDGGNRVTLIETKSEGLWVGHADGAIGTALLEHACSTTGNDFLAALAPAIETFTSQLNTLGSED